MLKRKMAVILVAVFLTGCGVNSVDISGNKNKTEIKIIEESAGDKDRTSIDHSKEDAVIAVESGIKSDEKENTSEEISETKMDIEDIFVEDIGKMIGYKGAEGYERVEKQVRGCKVKYLKGIFYTYQGVDLTNLNDGEKNYYRYSYNVSRTGIELEFNLAPKWIDVPIFNKEAAENEESWKGQFITSTWEKFEAVFKVKSWNAHSLSIEITPAESMEEEKFRDYKAVYTFEIGKGITSIDEEFSGENGDGNPSRMEIAELNQEEIKMMYKERWPEIDDKYIQQDEILSYYHDLNEDYFNELEGELNTFVNTNDIGKQEGVSILKDFYGEMPDDSLRAFSHIWDMAAIMYEATGDPYYLIGAVEEYERKIQAFIEIHSVDKVLNPVLEDYHIFMSKDYIMSKPYFNTRLEGKDKRRLDVYLENNVKPAEYPQEHFVTNESFVEEQISAEYPLEINNYLLYKKSRYFTEDSRYNKEGAEGLVKSLRVFEKRLDQGDTRYEKCVEEMYQELVNKGLHWRGNKLYIKMLEDYLKDNDNGRYIDEVEKKLDNILEYEEKHSATLEEKKDAYLELIGMEELEGDNEKFNKDYHEEELYPRLKENYEELEVISQENAVEVWNAYDLLNAVKDDAVIKIMDNIVIDPQRSTKFSGKASIGDGNIMFKGVKNLTIVGDGEYPVRISVGSTLAVIDLMDCENIKLRNLSLGHMRGTCIGPVIHAEDSLDITVENCILYGCGTKGLEFKNVNDVQAINTLIWDCWKLGVQFDNVHGANLNNVIITENGEDEIVLNNCTDINEKNVIKGDLIKGENEEESSLEQEEGTTGVISEKWKGIDQKYILEDEILKGYYDLSDDYYDELQGQLDIYANTHEIGKQEGEQILKEFYSKMPDDSPRAVSNTVDMASTMFKATGDSYYIIQGVEEYERKIKAINEIYSENKSDIPVIEDYYFFMTKDFIMQKPYFNTNLDEEERRRIDVYLENYIMPVDHSECKFSPMEKFVRNYLDEEYPEDIKSYLLFKMSRYFTTDSRYNFIESENLVKSLKVFENRVAQGDDRYEECVEEMHQYLIHGNPAWEPDNLETKTLEDYLEDNENGRYKEEVEEKLAKIYEYKNSYDGTLDEVKVAYKSYAGREKLEELKQYIERDYHEKELYSVLKNNYIEREEISQENAVEVWNGYDFLNAVRDDAIIKVMDDIVIDSQRDTVFSGKGYIYDGSIVFEGVKNLTIIGNGDYPVKISVGSTWAVIEIRDSENITLRNLSLGHLNDYCKGAVIDARDTSNIVVENSILYGCGTIGLDYSDVNNVTAVNTLIWDCSELGVRFNNVNGGNLRNLIITENGSNEIFMNQCTDIIEENIVKGDFNDEERIYFGEWEIKDTAIYHMGVYSQEEIDKMIGRRVIFRRASATNFGDSLEYLDVKTNKPEYTEEQWGKEEFFAGYKIPSADIENLPERFMVVSVENRYGSEVALFIVIDEDNLLLYGGGAFMDLERVENHKEVQV